MIDNGICKRFTKVFGLSEFSVTVTAAAAARETAAALSRILSAARPAMAVLAVLMLIFSTAGCQKEAGVVPAGQGANSRMRDLSTVMVPSNRMGLFADLSDTTILAGPVRRRALILRWSIWRACWIAAGRSAIR